MIQSLVSIMCMFSLVAVLCEVLASPLCGLAVI